MITPQITEGMDFEELKAEANLALLADYLQRAEREDLSMIYGNDHGMWPQLMTEEEARGKASMILGQG
jgi:hypothetical protein